MSYVIQLDKLSSQQIAFGFSVAQELLLSLHVLQDCKHHPLHIRWVMQARKRMSPSLKQEIEAFGFLYNRPIATFWELEADSGISSFAEELDQIKSMSVDVYVQEAARVLLRRNKDSDLLDRKQLREDIMQAAAEKHPKSTEAILELLDDPGASRNRFVRMLSAYWETILEEEWPRIEELFIQDITFRGRKLMQNGPIGVLENLSPEIAIDRQKQTTVIRRPSYAEIDFEEQDLLFISPSYFAWPHLFVKLGKPVTISYPVMDIQEDARTPVPPDYLVKQLRAMGDITRLQIVKLLAQRPRSTRELTGLIGISEAAVSKHLKQLQEANILTSKRESYYVFYQIADQTFSELKTGLDQLMQD